MTQKKKGLFILILAGILIALTAWFLLSTQKDEILDTETTTEDDSLAPADENSIRISSSKPRESAGLSSADSMEITLGYTLLPASGRVQIKFDQFSDDTCETPDTGTIPGGTSTLSGGLTQQVTGGTLVYTATVPPFPMLGARYVSPSAFLLADGEGTTVLAEDIRHTICFAVRTDAPVDAAAAPDTEVALSSLPPETRTLIEAAATARTDTSPATGAVLGYAFLDYNSNGTNDMYEPPAPGYTYILGDATCTTPLQYVTPNESQIYIIEGLTPGNYCIVINAPGVSVLPSTVQTVTVPSGDYAFAQFGIQAVLPPPPEIPIVFGGISGSVFMDPNANGWWDAGETGVGTYTISKYSSDCSVFYSTAGANAEGFYTFGNTLPGTYCIALDYTGTVYPQNNQIVTVTERAVSVAYFGIAETASPPPAPSMGELNGSVYYDSNANGMLDPGESGSEGYSISLYDIDCSTFFTSTSTVAGGSFTFWERAPGPYCLTIDYAGTVLPGPLQTIVVESGFASHVTFVIEPTAAPAGFCGDGNLDPGELCEPPNSPGCDGSCQSFTLPYCGNSIVESGEGCDPPNETDCTASCQTYVAWCGNGIVDWASGEQCEYPNTDTCDWNCQNYCGNGFLDWWENCDTALNPDCPANCQY